MSTQDAAALSGLRIGIDGCGLIAPNAGSFSVPKAGIGRYVYELAKALDRLMPDTLFFIYSPTPLLGMPLFSERWTLRGEPHPIWKKLRNTMWLKLRAASLIRRDKLNVFWCPEVARPGFLPRYTKTVVTVYDLIHELFPQVLRFPTRCRHRWFYRHDITNADAITTISHATAARLWELYRCRASAVVSCAVSENFRPADAATLANCLAKYRLTSPYLLSVATWQPNKNLENLIKAFLSMKREGLATGISLVLVGPRGWKDRRLAALVEQSSDVGIVPLGYVPEEDLPALYTGAEALVYPSLYEGFGLPVLEARSCGTKVVATDLPEIREAGGEDTIYITPDLGGIKRGISEVLRIGNKPLQSPACPPRWEDSAKVLAGIIQSLC